MVTGYELDWFSGQYAADARHLQLDHFYEITRDGAMVYEIDKWREVEGSFESKMRVRRAEAHPELMPCPAVIYRISGNPTKYRQGHNVFGWDARDWRLIVTDAINHFPEDVRPPLDGPIYGGERFRPSRLDMAVAIEMSSHERVHHWIRQAEMMTRSRSGRAVVSGTTVYWNQHSRRWTFKGYCKACELKDHPLPDVRQHQLLQNYSSTQLRLELCLRGQELIENLQDFGPDTLWKYYERLENATMITDADERVNELPTASRDVFRNWVGGYPVAQDRKRSSFYKHRRRILDTLGVDIGMPPSSQPAALPRLLLDGQWLKDHVVHSVPYVFDEWLWKPEGAVLSVPTN